MKEQKAIETLKKICPSCGKQVAAGKRSGSMTAFLFGAADCNCLLDGGRSQRRPISSTAKGADEIDFCPKCGLQIVAEKRDGSLTGFLFQSTRCKCPPDKAFADGGMSAKFWKLRRAGGGTTFINAPSAQDRASVSSIDLARGAIIGGAYKIIELIGRGGMGEVYLATHETLGKKCALKVIPPEQVTEIGWQRFQLEAKAVAKLDHVNLVRVTDLGIHEGCLPFYAMDYVEGKNLAELLAEQGPMPLKMMLEIFMQVCDGVECAHRGGILHRDLKPANIMLVTAHTGAAQAKVLDFGLAKLTKQDRVKQSLTAVGDIFGSPFYMSPEQCNGDKLDIRSDIYSLGCTMFECLTGQPPFSGQPAPAVMFSHLQEDPPSLESIVGPRKFPQSMEVVTAKLLRKNPAERYQTLSQLKADLALIAVGKEVLPVYRSRENRNVLPVQPVQAGPEVEPSPMMSLPDLSMRHAVMTFAVIFLLFTVGAFVFSFWSIRHVTIKPVLSKKPFRDSHRSVDLIVPADNEPFGQMLVSPLRVFVKGRAYRVWKGPPHPPAPLTLEYEDGGVIQRKDLLGVVDVPVDCPVCLILQRSVTTKPEFVTELQEHAFNEVQFSTFSSLSLAPALASLDCIDAIRLSCAGAAEPLTFASTSTKRSSRGSSFEVSSSPELAWTQAETAESIGKINLFGNLKRLVIFPDIDGGALRRLIRLKDLQDLRLPGEHERLHDCLPVISGSKNLLTLGIGEWSAESNDLQMVAACPNLKRLLIGRLVGSHEQISALVKLSQLTRLEIPELFFRSDLVADLKRLRALKVLKISRRAGWTAEQITQFKHALPHVELLFYATDTDQQQAFIRP